jgi:hypothetical protein
MPIKKFSSNMDFKDETVVENENQLKSKKQSNNKILWIILVVLLVALAVVSYNYFRLSRQTARLNTTEGQKEVVKKEVDELVKKVSKLIVLPTNEVPTVATITDASGLSKTQPFYTGASNGDKVLIYFQAQKAYIYSPSKEMLVNVGPVYIEQNVSSSTTTSATTEEQKKEVLNIEIRNGSNTSGSASQMSEKLKANTNYNIVGVNNAVTSTYKNTILVDMTNGNKAVLLGILEKELNLKAISILPNGEKTSTADVLFIIGEK